MERKLQLLNGDANDYCTGTSQLSCTVVYKTTYVQLIIIDRYLITWQWSDLGLVVYVYIVLVNHFKFANNNHIKWTIIDYVMVK